MVGFEVAVDRIRMEVAILCCHLHPKILYLMPCSGVATRQQMVFTTHQFCPFVLHLHSNLCDKVQWKCTFCASWGKSDISLLSRLASLP